MSEEIKMAIEEQKTLWGQHKKAVEEKIEAAEAGNTQRVGELSAKLEKIGAEMSEYAAKIERVDEVENTLNKMALGGGGSNQRRVIDAAFDAYMRKGDESGFQASATVQNDPDGGWLVPDNISSEITRVAQDTTAMRQLAAVQRISSGTSFIEFVTKAGAAAAFVGETGARTATDSPELAKIETTAHELYANPQASQRLLDDAGVNIDSWLVGEVGVAFAETEGAAFITGNGVEQPRGITAYDTVADGSYAWGTLGHIATGKAADWADTNPEKALIKLIHALKARYRNNAAFLANRNTLGAIREFKTTDRYLWQPSFQAGQPSTLLGYPVYEEDNMPNVATAGNLAVAFGDFRAGYRIVDHVMMRVLRDPYSNKPFVGFYTTKRVGGQVRNFEAIKVLKTAAS